MENIGAWLTSATGILTIAGSFLIALLAVLDASKKVVWQPIRGFFKWLLGITKKKKEKVWTELRETLTEFMDNSNKQDEKIIGMIEGVEEEITALAEQVDNVDGQVKDLDNQVKEIDGQVKSNESDRIRQLIFQYARFAKNGAQITDEEWHHLQSMYYKYHEELHGNGLVTEEYNYIKDYYYNQFKGKEQ